MPEPLSVLPSVQEASREEKQRAAEEAAESAERMKRIDPLLAAVAALPWLAEASPGRTGGCAGRDAAWGSQGKQARLWGLLAVPAQLPCGLGGASMHSSAALRLLRFLPAAAGGR